MAITELSQARPAKTIVARSVELVCFALVVAQAVYLATSYLQGTWLSTSGSGGLPTDFVNVWAAGKLVLEGHASAAYDWPVHKAMEVVALGHPFEGYFGWHYPPVFLFVATGLALVPYTAAHLLWIVGTFPAYLLAIRTIIGTPVGWLMAAAFPAVLCNFVVGQNGFLSAALFGAALVMLVESPILAGLYIGVLTFKPHLGLLIPIALIAGGYWRAFASATIAGALLALASWAVFGTEAWQAFAGNLGHTSHAFLSNGWADWRKLQTAFGLTRTLGGSESLAWTVQAIVALGAATVVAAVWRSRTRFEIKAMTLATASLLATPYLYTYDLVVLAVPLAFLFRLAGMSGFLPYELSGIALACLLILIFPVVAAPVGFAAILLVAALIARRIRHGRHAPVKT